MSAGKSSRLGSSFWPWLAISMHILHWSSTFSSRITVSFYFFDFVQCSHVLLIIFQTFSQTWKKDSIWHMLYTYMSLADMYRKETQQMALTKLSSSSLSTFVLVQAKELELEFQHCMQGRTRMVCSQPGWKHRVQIPSLQACAIVHSLSMSMSRI